MWGNVSLSTWKKNEKVNYDLNRARSLNITVQWDITHNVGIQVFRITSATLAFIACDREFQFKEVLIQLYRVLVRRHLEYCKQFLSPNFRKNVFTVPGVQEKFTRLNRGIKGSMYKKDWAHTYWNLEE